MEEEEEKIRAFGGSGGCGTMTTTTTMDTEMATDRSSRGGTQGGGAGLLPGIDKKDYQEGFQAEVHCFGSEV